MDDVASTRYALGRILSKAGFSIREAATGWDALNRAAHDAPDLVILDVQLPDMSGYEVCRLLKADAATRGIPVLQVSAHFTEPGDLARGLEGGADAYLVHPVEPLVLVATLRALLRTSRAEQQFRRLNDRLAEEIQVRQKTEEELRRNEQRLRATFNNAALGIVEVDAGDRIIDVNERMCQILDYSREDLVGICIHDLTAPEDRERSQRLNAMLHERRRDRIEYEKRYLKRDGSPLWVRVAVTAIRDQEGAWVRSVGTVEDISQRKAAEEELRRSEERHRIAAEELQAIMDAAPAGICVAHDPQCQLITGNAPAHELFGVPPGQNMSATPREPGAFPYYRVYRDGREVQGPDMPVQVAARTGTSVHDVELEAVRRDGTRRVFLLNAAPLRSPDGTIRGAVGAFTDITERKQAEEELISAKHSAEHAKAAAEEASRAKDQFLAVLSHELRTPLTPVVAAVSMLQKQWFCDAPTSEILEMIRRNVEMEARLIDDLLDVTRITRGKVELDRRPIPLCEVIRRAVEVCRPDIEGRRLHFGVDMGPAAPYIIHADAARLQQVFWNLLKNAIKFTPHGGCVGIRCRLDGHAVIADVMDTGEGIEADLLVHIFSPFEQGGTRVTRQFGGLGLGLTITRGLVEMHGGSITAHSAGRGRGATFRVRLPLHQDSQPVAPAAQSPASGQPGKSPPQASSLRILLVEDHGDTARAMRRLLMSDGHEVQTAGDVATALELAAQGEFDLLISDLGLPDASGLDLMRQLRQGGFTFPGIALSGYGQEEDILRSREAGFAAHLTKPTSPERLAEAIAAQFPPTPA